MATHSSVLAWRIPGMVEPGGLPYMGSHRFRHDWSDLAAEEEEKEKKKGYEKIFEEIIVENYPNMEKEIVNQVQEAWRVPYRINLRRNTPRYILIKLTKNKHKERILEAAREKQQVTYKGNSICLTADLSAETLQARREWQDRLKVKKVKNQKPRLLDLARITFRFVREIKSVTDMQKLREFSTTKAAI